VSCSFLALVLKKALEDRIADLGKPGSWPEILADLNSLTETEIQQDNKRFMLRSAPRPAASLKTHSLKPFDFGNRLDRGRKYARFHTLMNVGLCSAELLTADIPCAMPRQTTSQRPLEVHR